MSVGSERGIHKVSNSLSIRRIKGGKSGLHVSLGYKFGVKKHQSFICDAE
jgi:hypothetical protein